MEMDDFCMNCWNDDCKEQSDEFRNEKLQVCKHQAQFPELWEESLVYNGTYDFYEDY